MPNDPNRRTAGVNGRLWGSRAHDWAEIQEGGLRPVYEVALSRVPVHSGVAYLDVGCGAGMAAQIAAARGARVSGLDAAENLLAIARARVPQGEFRVGELEELPYRDGSFDVITAFNALQFASDSTAALKEVRRVAKEGAHVAIVSWGTPEGMDWVAISNALKALMPPRLPGAPGTFALSEERALRTLADSAGLEAIEILDVESPFTYPNFEIAIRGLLSSGNAVRAIELIGEEKVRHTYADVLQQFVRSDGSYRIGARFRCLLART